MFTRSAWPLVTAVASATLLAAAHGFQRLGGLAPCPLCLDQRNWHWGVLAASLASFALLRRYPGLARWCAALLGLLLLGSAAQAAFHVAVEQGWVIYRCEAAPIDFSNTALDDAAKLDFPRCDEALWRLFGISMAGYNALISLMMALASFVIALAPERKP